MAIRIKITLPEKYRDRVMLSPGETCEVAGFGRSFFYEHVAPKISLIRRGRRTFVPVAELLRWFDDAA